MRVLIYVYEFAPLGGGIGNEIKHLLVEFERQAENIQFDVITASLDDKFETQQLHDNVTLYRIPVGSKRNELHEQSALNMIKFIFWSYWQTWRLVVRHRYDLNLVFGFPGALVSMLFRWLMPYLVALKGIDVPGYNDKFRTWYLIYKPITWASWLLADKVLPISLGMQRLAEETFRSNKKYEVVENGIDIDEFTPLDDDQKFDKFTITAGGTLLGKIKGLEYLIEGFAKLHEKYEDTQLLLIGDGYYKDVLVALTQELEIEDAVEFVGRKPHEWIETTLPKCHVFCLPSNNEGMSNALLEAVASGLPVIFTPTGGSDELVKENGFIVPKQDGQAVGVKLIELYENDQMRADMGKVSRQIAEGISWKSTAKKYIDLFLSYKK